MRRDPLEEWMIYGEFKTGLSPDELVKKHRFLYLYDYGDQNEFEVEVIDIRPQAGPGKYPLLIDSRGESPEQYLEW